MKVFTCNNFTGRWPVGTAAVIVAEDEDTGLEILLEALDGCGLPQKEGSLVLKEIAADVPGAVILCDGNY